jgi:hypothetical protein
MLIYGYIRLFVDSITSASFGTFFCYGGETLRAFGRIGDFVIRGFFQGYSF